jgi:type IV pilus assembly protein PilM
MAKGRIGLDVGSTAVRAVELSTGGTPSVLRAAQVALPAGAVENGEVRDPDVVGEALRELWQSGGFKGRQVYMGVGNQRVVVREIAIPWLPEKELRASLGFQVQEFIPMATDEAVLDFDPLGEFEHEDRRMLRMLLVAAQRTMVDGLIRAAQVAKLEPLGLDLVPFALVRSVGSGDAGMDLEEEGEEAVIDIGAHVTNIVVHERGRTKFVRILPSGGRDVTLAIARAASVEDEVAERLKRGEEVELPDDDAFDDDDAEPRTLPSSADVRSVALTRAGAFVDEIRSSLEFYTAQSREARIGHVLVTGGGSKLDGLLELMRQRIPVPVDPGRVFEHVGSQLHMPPEVQADAEPGLAVAVGLAIPGRDK